MPFASGQNIAFPPVALWVTVGLAVCLLVLLIALAAVCRRKIKESCEEARREGRGNGQKRRFSSAHSTLVYILTMSTMMIMDIHALSLRLDKSMFFVCLTLIKGEYEIRISLQWQHMSKSTE